MRYIEDPTPRLVMRRAARENLYAPEYTEKFQNYVMNLWARDCYAPKDSRDDLVALIRACPTDPQNACKFAAQYNWKEYTNTELELRSRLWSELWTVTPVMSIGFLKR